MKEYVFRRKRVRNGKRQTSRVYTGRFQLPGDLRPTDVPLDVTDKRVAENKLRQFVVNEERRQAGLVIPAELVNGASRPLSDHLDDFLKDKASLGRAKDYRLHLRNRVNKLLAECQWKHAKDITADSFVAWRTQQKAMSAKTANDYLDAASGLVKWMISQRRLASNPLASVERVDGRGRETFERAVLTADEFQRLLQHAGSNRRVLYLVAVMTSLRRGTLYKLTWADVHLDEAEAFIRVRAAHNKNRQEQICELREDVVAELRRIRPADSKPSSRVFNRILPYRHTDFLKDDLKAAGITREGRERFDFHALRHTACTWAANSGQHGPNLRAFSGHKTDRQLSRYTHPTREVVRRVVETFPRFDLAERGTHIGTPGSVAECPNQSVSVAVGKSAAIAKGRNSNGKTRAFQAENASLGAGKSEWAIEDLNL
ncbi:MAG: tyrosine-type recombinase/integrase [Phycisphaeraceae bacterium]